MNTVIAVLQLLVAVAFLSIPVIRNRYGARATATAHAELERQGVRPGVLAENGMRFDAGGHETAAPVAVAAVMLTLAVLNVAGSGWAHPLTWALQAIVLLGNVVIVYSNRTAARSVAAAFAREGDPELTRIDVPALLAAAEAGFPRWTWTVQTIRNITVFGASAGVLTALALA